MANTIRHQGIVENINGSHLQVRIIQTSACATCSIKGHCTSADTKEKLIDVGTSDVDAYHIGDRVWVVGEVSMGMQAVLLAFVIPLFILIAALFVSMAIEPDELKATACALPCLALYYFMLWLCRSKLKKRFLFTVVPMG